MSQSLYGTDSKYGNGRVGAIFEIDSLNSVGAEIELYQSSFGRNILESNGFSKELLSYEEYGELSTEG